MQTVWLHQHHRSTLILFFAGWASDPTPFSPLGAQHVDVLCCFDYRSIRADEDLESIVDGYRSVVVVAWSFGVAMANQLCKPFANKLTDAVAINGTLCPIDDQCGIAVQVFSGTLQQLSETNLQKFNRRMFSQSAHRDVYDANKPQRIFLEVVEELVALGGMSVSSENNIYQRAIVGQRDLIFTSRNQLNAWQNKVEITVVDHGHFPFYAYPLWDSFLM